tara:strand:+ start:1212 stop:1844 length:633 start_codon:yes stop_codon:yes gene_type:complete
MNNELKKRFLSSIIILPVALLAIINGSTLFVFFLGFLFLATSFEWIKMSKKNLFKNIIGIIFLILSFFSAFQLRSLYGYDFFILVLLACIFTDLGGFFFGKIFKGPKLTRISPNKTYSGVVGSFFLPILFCFIYNNYFNLDYAQVFKINLILLILLISLISQSGDLIISYFKRIAKVKDTGKILPGHGGILDRLDGLIFVIPILYFFTKL